MFGGDQDPQSVNPIIKSRHDFAIMDESKSADKTTIASPQPVIHLEHLFGRSFLMDKQEDGQQ
jgi:hypothetical protein